MIRQECGTMQGWNLHRKNKERACFECYIWRAWYERERRARPKRRQVLVENSGDKRMRITQEGLADGNA
jgi:hypothetical protein